MQQKQADIDTLKKFFKRGGSLRMLNDIDQSDLDTLYQHASQLMSSGHYKRAKNIYYLLMRIDSWNFDFCFSLGLVYQQLEEHEEAIYCFSRAGMINVDNPVSAYHAGLSYLSLNNKEYAKKSFNASLRWCNNQKKFEHIEQLAKQKIALLKQDDGDQYALEC